MSHDLQQEIRARKEKILTLKNEIKVLQEAASVLGIEGYDGGPEKKEDDEDDQDS